MRTGPTLTEDRPDKFEPLGAFGQPVYRNHVQLQAALRQRLGEKYANFFALPQFDSQGKTVRWISPVEGDAVRWSELSEEDQIARSLDLQVMKSEFDTYLTELRAYRDEGKEPRGAKAFVAVLEQALKTPNDGHLFFVGDQPVAAFWGFKETDHPPFEILTAAPRIAPGQARPAAAVPPLPVAETSRRFAWWWLLLPLLLLLLALLLWWFWPDDRTDDAFESDRPAVEEPLEDRRLEAPINLAVDRTIVDLDDVLVPGGAIDGAVDGEGKPTTDGEAATIPDDAQDGAAGFMSGSWRSDSGLVDNHNQKVILEYKFDNDGKGEAVIRRANGVTCRAPATANVQGGKLQVEELANFKCDDGSAFQKSRTVCTRDATGRAECIGTYAGGRGYEVDLIRGGQP